MNGPTPYFEQHVDPRQKDVGLGAGGLSTPESEALLRRLESFDASGVAFPKIWKLIDSIDQRLEDWEELKPANWVDLPYQLFSQKSPRGIVLSLMSLQDFVVDLERMLKVSPKLWTAFVENGGRCAFRTGAGPYEASGVAHDHQHISYANGSGEIFILSELLFSSSPNLCTRKSPYDGNTLAHEIAHVMDHQAQRLERSKEKYWWGRSLFASSPLFQEAFSLAINSHSDHPVTRHIIRKLNEGGGIKGCQNNLSAAFQQTREVRRGERLPGDDFIYDDDEMETAYRGAKADALRQLREKAGVFEALCAKDKSRQLRLPSENSRNKRMNEKAGELAYDWVSHRDCDAHSTWNEAFARTSEIYYGTPELDPKSLPYQSLSHFLKRCAGPLLDILESDTFTENKTAYIAVADGLLHQPLRAMMTRKDYKRYVDLREAMGDEPVMNTFASKEIEKILMQTIERIADEIDHIQTHQPRQKSLFR